VPTLAASKQKAPGNNWAWSTYTQLVSSLAYDFLLKQLLVSTSFGASVNLGASPIVSYIQGTEHIQIATGPSQSETPVAEAQVSESGYMSLPVGTGAVILVITTCRDIPISPVKIPSSTRISIRTTLDTTLVVKSSVFYLSGYDLTSLGFTDVEVIDKSYEKGTPAYYPKLNPLASMIPVSSSGTNWVLGDYVTVIDSLADDYLIWGAATNRDITNTMGVDAQFDVALGEAGSEVVQARWGLNRSQTYLNAGHVIFPWPFIAYAGERLSIRVADDYEPALDYGVSLYGVKL
jgi:hypothetical protein